MGLSKKDRYVYCADCGCRLEMNGVCKKCGHADEPLLAGMVPNVVGLLKTSATKKLKNPEAQLILGNVTTENSDTVEADRVISSEPIAGTQLTIGDPVNIVVSSGPAV